MKYILCEVLTPDMEKKLISEAQQGSIASRNRLVLAHFPFIRMLASRYFRPSHLEVDDMVHAAVLGFIKAIDHWRDNKGCQLISYAGHWVRKTIHDEKEYSQLYRVPRVTLQGYKQDVNKTKTRARRKTWMHIQNFKQLILLQQNTEEDQVCPKWLCEEIRREAILDTQTVMQSVSARTLAIVKAHSEGTSIRRIGKQFGADTHLAAKKLILQAIDECKKVFCKGWKKC